MTLELTFMGHMLAEHAQAKRSTMPVCIDVHHIGVHPESEYDEFGETAPATWICVCGGRLKSARLERVSEYIDGCYVERDEWDYVGVSDERRDLFWAAHRPCEVAVLELAAETGAEVWEVCSDLRSWTLTEERRYNKTGEFAEVDKTEYLTHDENVAAFGASMRRSVRWL